MSTTVTYQGDTIATLENETKTLLTQGKWAENNIIITDSTRGGVETETDPVFSASPAANITQTNINNWNNKSNFSGNYNDLTNKPILDTSLSTSSTKAVENKAISIALEDKASKSYVDTAISNIPSPMIFKGSLGTSGTITALPSADATNTGFTYKVIQAGTYASQAAEIGDIFISDGTTWILVPSGDDIANVVVTPVQSSGTKIAVVTVNNTSTDLYAPTPIAPPNASTLAPNMDGTAAAGTSTSYARADHIHPVDTSRASVNDVSSLTTRVGSLETAIGTGGSVDNKIATAIQGLDSSITATSGEAISAITITDGKITTSSKIIIPTYSVATTAANGLMSAADKAKINALSTVDNNTTYANATTASDGLMSSADKTKLDTFRPLLYVKDGNNVSVLLGNTAQNVASGDYSIAEGNQTTASSLCAHAEGGYTVASSTYSHAEGNGTTASAQAAHAEGYQTNANGYYSHAEGKNAKATNEAAHAEGGSSLASGWGAHAEGRGTTASGYYAHAEGDRTQASGYYAHAEGFSSRASSNGAHAEGSGTASGQKSHAEGNGSASGLESHAEGRQTQASGWASHAEGLYTIANHRSQHVFGEYNITDASTAAGDERGTYIEIVGNGYEQGYSTIRRNARTLDWDGNETLAGKLTVGADPTAPMEVATKQYVDNNSGSGESSLQYIKDGTNDSVLLGDVNNNIASGLYSIAEGYHTTASGEGAHSEGARTLASTAYSHAEGAGTTASGPWSHAEGNDTIASSYSSHVEGCNSTASGSYSHAEGYGTLVSAQLAHAEGYNSTAAGKASHAEGNQTLTIGKHSHAEGSHTTASGESSHSGGNYTIATRDSQTVIGKYNKITSNNNSTVSTDAAFVIGNGSSGTRSDAFAVKWDGTLVFANGAELSPAQVTQLLALLN